MREFGVVLLALAGLPGISQAGVGWSVGINVGSPYYYRPYYYRPYYYGPPWGVRYGVYVAPPPVIVEPVPVATAVPVTTAVAVPPPPPPVPAASLAQPAATLPEPRPVEASTELANLNSTDERVRADAILRLGRRKDRRAVQPLIKALREDSSPAVRETAARALGLIGAPAALTALQHAAGADDDRDVRRSASFAADVIRANLGPR
jgi:hypothetical protein